MKKLYIGNLPYRFHRGELESFLSAGGEIEALHLVKDKSRRRLKGFGFVTFVDAEGAKAALALDGDDFYGRNIKISVAKDQSFTATNEDDEEDFDSEDLPSHCASSSGSCFKTCFMVCLISVVVAAVTSYVTTDYVLTHKPASIFASLQ